MPKGHADWNVFSNTVSISQLGDLGELAARMGSPDTFERSGNIIYIENFEKGFTGWNITALGANAGAWLSTLAARTGGYCVAIYPGTTATYKTLIEKRLPYFSLSRLGLEMSIVAHDELLYGIIGLQLFDGTYGYKYYLRHNWKTDVLEYLNDSEVWTTLVDPLLLSPEDYLFHTFKLIVDPVNKMYSRVYIDSYGYDMSTLAVYPNANASSPHIRIYTYAEQELGDTGYLLLDDVILTQNEPEGG